LELGEWVATLAQTKMLLQATRNSTVTLIKKHAYFKNFITIRNMKAPTVFTDKGAGWATESVRTFWKRNKFNIEKEKRLLKRVAIPGCALFCCRIASDNNFDMIILLNLLYTTTPSF
jgi:hypothetical protein